jgi:hypothetical protein
MKNPSSPNNAYQIAVIYTGDGKTTAVNLKIMTLDGSNLVVGHDFTIPLHRVDLLVDQVRQAINGGYPDDGLLLEVSRKDDWIVFDGPLRRMSPRPVHMTAAGADLLATTLDEIQDAIITCLDAGVRFFGSSDTPTPMALVTSGGIDAFLTRANDQVLLMNERLPKTLG